MISVGQVPDLLSFQSVAEVQIPDVLLSAPPGLSDKDRADLLEWGTAVATYPRHSCIHELFADRVREDPEAVALIGPAESLTYQALDDRSNQLAHRLLRQGVLPGSRVAVSLSRGCGLVVALLGVLKAGAAYLYLDPSWPSERRELLIQDAEVTVVVTQQDLDALAGESVQPPAVGVSAQHLAYVCYTSGSTGRPKGVEVEHRGVVRLVVNNNYAWLTRDEVLLQVAAASFDASTFEIWGALLHGARLVVLPPGPLDPTQLGTVIRRHGVTTLLLTTGLLNHVIDQQVESLQPLRQLLFGGEAASVPHLEKARRNLPGVRLVNVYGPTENTTISTTYTVPAEGALPLPFPIGRPVANSSVYVLGEQGELVPVGTVGEIYVGGDGLARGYLNRPELTAERFRTIRGERLYQTGDRGRWRSDGELEFLGRTDAQLKIRGYRVEPGEVESLLSQHAGVRLVVVAGRPDSSGNGTMLVAWMVLQDGVSTAEVRSWLKERVPEYMVPLMQAVAELPINAHGKVEVRALPMPEPSSANYCEPRTPLEGQLLDVWRDVLKTPKIGVLDSFFELGGHSLLGVEVLARVEPLVGRRLTLATLFEAPTIAALAVRLEAPEPDAALNSTVVPLQPQGTKPNLYWIHTLGGDGGGGFTYYRRLAGLLGKDQPSFGIRAPEQPYTCIEAMAAAYTEEVLTHLRGAQVCSLAGYCFGGNVAFEVGRRLQSRGVEVRRVILIESSAWNAAKKAGPGSSSLRIKALWRRVVAAWTTQSLRSIGKRAGQFLQRRLRPGRWTPQLEEFLDLSQYPPAYVQAARVHWQALTVFKPVPWPGRVLLVRSSRPPWDLAAVADYGWGPLALAGVDVLEVAGDHDDILHDPHIQTLASALASWL